MRVGFGVDSHRFASAGVVLLGGVRVDESRGVAATSDGDVLAHAVADALLGAAALGDLGALFPAEHSQGADSMELLATVVARLAAEGLAPAGLDATVISQSVRVAAHRDAIRAELAEVLGLDVERISVKGTTTDGLGFTGSDEGIAVTAVAVLTEK
ncbi:MAG: 2-C-methyl-D-erythritol 2,4-cyclodiphosphate synthase [Acidimicrobiia bacterium]|nr:2-C-methyl-D-erythritol 2,4-cyclodiphosphate synthase [Acidimicrobiia bacterium]